MNTDSAAPLSQKERVPIPERAESLRKEKSCGAVVYKKTESGLQFLLEHMVQGHTSIPKGHVENQETEEETALREIREETGLNVKLDTSFRHVINYSPAPGVTKDVIFFAAESLPGPMANQESEVAALEWMPYEKALSALTHASDRETLTAAWRYLTQGGKSIPG